METPTVRVTRGHLWRDASGTFACPSCEATPPKHGVALARLRPGDGACPKCGAILEWALPSAEELAQEEVEHVQWLEKHGLNRR